MWSNDFFDEVTKLFFTSNDIPENVISFFKSYGIKHNSRILEQSCGTGVLSNSLSINLNSRSTGLDIIPLYIEEANLNNKKNQKLNKFLVKDITKSEFIGLFNFVINYNTSCNYYKEDEKNQSFFNHAFINLKKDGLFFLDFYNSDFLIDNLKSLRIEEQQIEKDYYKIEKISSIENKMLLTKIKIYKNNELLKDSFGETKMYSVDEIESMLLNSGFKEIIKYSNYDKELFEINNSPRVVFVSKK